MFVAMATISKPVLQEYHFRGHFNDEKKIYELLIRIFRSPELIVKLTENHPSSKSVRRITNGEE